ncbi:MULTISPECIES: hypothetical protein [unclassified Microcoleus]|uniref:hypothetical protein n=1 Tax=unclassified Microcoleus TaxID=2642155 RepID=UPI0025D33731|nr:MULTISPECIES: hypothetical protein [unclassified Microcoleus]
MHKGVEPRRLRDVLAETPTRSQKPDFLSLETFSTDADAVSHPNQKSKMVRSIHIMSDRLTPISKVCSADFSPLYAADTRTHYKRFL